MKVSGWKRFVPYLLSVAAIIIFGFYIYQNADLYQQLFNFSTKALLILIGLRLLSFLLYSLGDYIFYHGLNISIGFGESVGLKAVNVLANQLPFAGGLVARSIYLKKRYTVSHTRFLSATAALYVSFVSISGLLGIGVLAYWAMFEITSIPFLLVLGFSVMTLSIISYWLPIRYLPVSRKWMEWRKKLAQGWQVFREDLSLLGKLIFIHLLSIIIQAGRFWIAFRMLSQEVTFLDTMLFSSASLLTSLASIAPGGIGVREGIVAGIGSLLGFNPAVSAVAVGIDRVVATSITILLGVISTNILSKKITNPPDFEEVRSRNDENIKDIK